MVPAGPPTDDTITKLSALLSKGDIIIDGGNSNYKETIRRAELLESKGIEFVDCGTSGGIWGLAEGYSLMIGGKQEVVEKLSPIFETLAPAKDQGWGYVGPHGAGHFVKMVHNGIEYGMMQSLAEGFNIMRAKKEFGLDLANISEIWRYGSVVRSWLLDLTALALKADPTLSDVEPWVVDFGRRPLDGGGGNRSRCAGADHHAGPTDALRQPRPGELRRAPAIGAAERIWRTCGQESGIGSAHPEGSGAFAAMSNDLSHFHHHLWRFRRPDPAQADPVPIQPMPERPPAGEVQDRRTQQDAIHG